MNCEVCGTELPFGAMFCGECGRAVGARTTEVRHPDSGMLIPVPLQRGAQSGQRDTVILEPLVIPEHENPIEDIAPAATVTTFAPVAPAEPVVPAEAVVPVEPVASFAPEPVPGPEADVEVEQDLPPEVVEEEEEALAAAPTDAVEQPAALAEQPPAAPAAAPAGDAVGDEQALRPDPFPWGDRGSAIFLDSDELEQTLITTRHNSGERFVLQFSTGESVTVFGTGLLGRNPVPQPGEYFDQLVAISDPGKSVSKTHLEFGQEGGAFWVSDRYSGNGSVVREPETAPRRLVAGRRYRIVRGSRVDIGEQFLVVS